MSNQNGVGPRARLTSDWSCLPAAVKSKCAGDLVEAPYVLDIHLIRREEERNLSFERVGEWIEEQLLGIPVADSKDEHLRVPSQSPRGDFNGQRPATDQRKSRDLNSPGTWGPGRALGTHSRAKCPAHNHPTMTGFEARMSPVYF